MGNHSHLAFLPVQTSLTAGANYSPSPSYQWRGLHRQRPSFRLIPSRPVRIHSHQKETSSTPQDVISLLTTMSGQTSDLFLSPDEQDLLVAALNSNQPGAKSGSNQNRSQSQDLIYTPQTHTNPGSGQLNLSDDSPYLDFDPDGDFDDGYDFGNTRMIGDLPPDMSGDLHDKRKSIDGENNGDEGDRKRREGDDRTAKKPGRKPLTSEPTSKRKAQNRAAQRAFRERKEQHLKDLETKVEDLEKVSEATNHENGLLKAQVERLQVELKEYRKRLSRISSNGMGRSNSLKSGTQKSSLNSTNDFQFEFPKFGDLPAMSGTNIFNKTNQQPQQPQQPQQSQNNRSGSAPGRSNSAPKATSNNRSSSQGQQQRQSSLSQSPMSSMYTNSPQPMNPQQSKGSVDSLTGLFSPSILEATRHATRGGYFPQSNNFNANPGPRASMENGTSNNAVYSNSTTSNSDSPGSSSESHNAISSIGTSPEPSLNSPGNKLQEFNLNTISEENQIPNNFGFNTANFSTTDTNTFTNDNAFDVNNSWLPAGSGADFDPVLFGDYREVQDNILSQDFGSFFNDAYPLPDLGSPLHNYSDVAPEQTSNTAQSKIDLLKQVEAAKNGTDEVVPDTDKPMTCNKIWDRLQSMEKFRNGEIDIDNLCSELRAKAKCSEGGAVVDKRDVDKILGKGH